MDKKCWEKIVFSINKKQTFKTNKKNLSFCPPNKIQKMGAVINVFKLQKSFGRQFRLGHTLEGRSHNARVGRLGLMFLKFLKFKK